MESSARLPTVQFLMYRFGTGAHFEGQLVGALERMESGGTLSILDVLLVMRDADTGELAAVDLKGTSAGGLVAPLLGFRLDLAERRRATKRALGDTRETAVPAATVKAIGDTLEPGAAIAAILVEHSWARALDDAVARIGGAALADGFVAARTLAHLSPDLIAAAGRRGARATADRPG